MLKPEQVPDEVFEAFQKAWAVTSTLSTKECLAAAINAWAALSASQPAPSPKSEPDWFWRDLDPDDSGDSTHEALRFVPSGTVCCISSSYIGPTFFAARVPVLDRESDDEEVLQANTQENCILLVRERLKALDALPPAPLSPQHHRTRPDHSSDQQVGPLEADAG